MVQSGLGYERNDLEGSFFKTFSSPRKGPKPILDMGQGRQASREGDVVSL